MTRLSRHAWAFSALMAACTAGATTPDFGPDFVPTKDPNMNGEYVMAATPGGTPGKFPKQFRDYPGGVEYYEVLSPPMTTYYSQVWWKPLAPVDFPKEMVEKYSGKTAAFVGWETDQVQIIDGKEVSVPISASYNHHYNSVIIGGNARFKEVMLSGPDDPLLPGLLAKSHGHVPLDQPHYVVEGDDGETGSSSFITSGNGGEYRKTYHGFAPGHAILVNSPTQWQLSPMQIDTWNREKMDITGPSPPKFVPGPLPRASEAPEGATYSGLLECPLTTRITKALDGSYEVESQSPRACSAEGQPILTFQECFHAAATTVGGSGQNFVNSTGSDPAKPAGCSITTDAKQPLTVRVFFNTLVNSTAGCAQAQAVLTGAARAPGVGTTISVRVDAKNDLVTIKMQGPSDVWFAAGFGAQAMEDRPWTVVVDGGSGAVSERKLGGPVDNPHVPGDALKASVKVESNTVSAGVRTVVVTRPLKGASADYYTFNTTTTNPSLPFITAVGSSAKLSYHKAKAPASMVLLPEGTSAPGACVCPHKPAPFGQGTGRLYYTAVANQTVDKGTGYVSFGGGKTCRPFPATVLLEQRNPTCDIRYYRGGQWACHHGWSLLDADQDIPWQDKPLVFHQKWRFYVQPYNETYHTGLQYGFNTSLLLGSPYEYDVPDCKKGNVPGCSLENGTWIHTVTGATKGWAHFAALNFHCHAPTCISMSVYMCDKSVPLEACNTTSGKLICEQRPVYGGSGAPELNGTRFDETGYIAIPDCFWGPEEFGLEAPMDLTDVPLFMLKKANATWPHYGEMAGGQPFVYV